MKDVIKITGFLAIGAVFFAASGFAVDVVSDRDSQCERLELTRELAIYKDPSMFLPNLAQIYADPEVGIENLLEQDPILTRRKKDVSIMKLGEPGTFRNFEYISKLYGLEEPRLSPDAKKEARIIAVRICGDDAYSDSLGFVLEEDLQKAQVREGFGIPPSVLSIPKDSEIKKAGADSRS